MTDSKFNENYYKMVGYTFDTFNTDNELIETDDKKDVFSFK